MQVFTGNLTVLDVKLHSKGVLVNQLRMNTVVAVIAEKRKCDLFFVNEGFHLLFLTVTKLLLCGR